MTERLHCHFSLSCTGEGNGNPLQCSCLENLRDGGAWWAAIYGVAQSRTRLKRLSSSSSSNLESSNLTSVTPSSATPKLKTAFPLYQITYLQGINRCLIGQVWPTWKSWNKDGVNLTQPHSLKTWRIAYLWMKIKVKISEDKKTLFELMKLTDIIDIFFKVYLK